MNIQNIETADCLVLSTVFRTTLHEMTISFKYVYDLDQKQYINNVSLVIRNWSHFEAKLYTSETSTDIPEEKILSDNDLVSFDYIQIISTNDNHFLLQGYGKGKGWLTYCFVNSEFCIVKDSCVV